MPVLLNNAVDMGKKLALFMITLVWNISVHAQTITLTKTSDIDYGPVEFSNPISGDVAIGTNGVISYGASFSGSGIGSPGAIEISVLTGTAVEIFCQRGAKLADTSNNTINLDIEVSMSPTVNYGNGRSCRGLRRPAIRHTATGNTGTDTVYIGAGMNNTNGNTNSGFYSTANPGGTPAFVRVTLQ